MKSVYVDPVKSVASSKGFLDCTNITRCLAGASRGFSTYTSLALHRSLVMGTLKYSLSTHYGLRKADVRTLLCLQTPRFILVYCVNRNSKTSGIVAVSVNFPISVKCVIESIRHYLSFPTRNYDHLIVSLYYDCWGSFFFFKRDDPLNLKYCLVSSSNYKLRKSTIPLAPPSIYSPCTGTTSKTTVAPLVAIELSLSHVQNIPCSRVQVYTGSR